MENRDFIKVALAFLGLFAFGMITAYIEGLDTSGGTYYMVRGFVSTEEKVGFSGLIGFMGLVGFFCCVIAKIKDSLNNINSKKIADRCRSANRYSSYCIPDFWKFDKQ